ncbi:solute carrier family 15 member 4-like [Watersipora subatra]|uniref:solute carrier family 15 member 4-like n=1 Tax=Watersipora subatra TaxID=2589382 RepID=UPI00355BE6F3
MALDGERLPLLGNFTVTRPSHQRKIACTMVLLAEMFERMACYSLSGNLIYFLTKEPLCWSSWISTTAVLVYTAVMYITGLFGGWISDSYLGRYHMIVIGYVIYVVGYAYLPLLTNYTREREKQYTPIETRNDSTSCNTTWPTGKPPFFCVSDQSPCSITFFIFITVIGIGAGVVRTNLAPFGGDQARGAGSEMTQTFFSLYYWSINIGSILAFVGVAYLQEWNFFYGFLVSGSGLLLSLICFLLGSKFYLKRPAGEVNVFKNVINLIANAYSVRKNNSGLRTTVYNFLDHANMEYEGGEFNIHQINDVKTLWKICKVFLLMVPYWICYSQMNANAFLLQGLHLRLNFANKSKSDLCPERNPNNSSFNIFTALDCRQESENLTSNNYAQESELSFPPAALAVFNSIFIIIMLPLTKRLYRACSRKIKIMTYRRLCFGMFLATLALVAGGALEFLRRRDIYFCGYHHQLLGHTVYDVSPRLSIFWQIPQYCLLGASEVFFIVTGIEYAYMEAPMNMQGIVMGLFWFCAGIGYFIGVALPYIFSVIGGIWKDPVYINCDKLDLFFYILAVVLILFSIIFVFISKNTDLGLTTEIHVGQHHLIPDSVTTTPQLGRRNPVEALNRVDSNGESLAT